MLMELAAIVLGLLGLFWSASKFIDGAAAVALQLGLSPLLIGMTIVSVGTSAPEILVSLMASSTGAGGLAVGNAFGSNITNIGLVLGATLAIAPIHVGRTTVFSDLPILLGCIALCYVLLWDRSLDSSDALVLFIGLGLVLLRLSLHAQKPDQADQPFDPSDLSAGQAWLRLVVGLGILILSSRLLVWGASTIALAMGVSELIIGLTIVAIGTSLPELAASVVSAMRGHADIAIGAVLGSNIFNLLIVLSLPGFFSTLPLEDAAVTRDLTAVALSSAALAIITWFCWNRQTEQARLGRRSGALFLVFYIVYLCLLGMQPELSL